MILPGIHIDNSIPAVTYQENIAKFELSELNPSVIAMLFLFHLLLLHGFVKVGLYQRKSVSDLSTQEKLNRELYCNVVGFAAVKDKEITRPADPMMSVIQETNTTHSWNNNP